MPTNPPDCETVARALWEYLDGRMDPARRGQIEDHLAWCAGCRAHTDFERALMDRIGRIGRERHPGVEALRARVLEALQEAGLERHG